MKNRLIKCYVPKELDDGGADDRAVGEVGHLLRLLGRGDAKADGAGNICVFPHEGDDGGEVGLDLTALARDAERRDDIEEALGLARDHRDAVFRRRCDEGDEVDAVLAARGKKFFLFLIRHVRQDEPVDANIAAVGQKALCAVGKDDIRIRHKNHGDRHAAPQLAHEIENLVGRYAALQGAQVSGLNDGPLRRGVGEGNAELDEVGTVLRGSADGSRGRFKIGVAAGQKGDERLAVVKCSCKITHEDPPLCSGRWRRSPCRRGRRS